MATTVSNNTGNFRFDPMTNEYEVYDGKTWTSVNPQRGMMMNHAHQPAVDVYTSNQTTPPVEGYYPFSIAAPPGNNKFQVNTKSGVIVADLETGDLTLPVGMSRKDGLREFWLTFQEHFKGSASSEYEQQIIKLNNEVKYYKSKLATFNDNVRTVEKEKIIDKVRNKYGSEKFIMTKPDELIKLLESE